MEENVRTAAEQTTAEPAAETRTFTQEEVNTMCAREAGKAERAILRQFGLASKDGISDLLTQLQAAQSTAESLRNITGERDDFKAKYDNAYAELSSLKNAQVLAAHGITDNDEQEFYAFKIGKMVTDKKDFAAAAKEYFEEHPVNKARVQLAVEHGTASIDNNENAQINAAIRSAAGFRM